MSQGLSIEKGQVLSSFPLQFFKLPSPELVVLSRAKPFKSSRRPAVVHFRVSVNDRYMATYCAANQESLDKFGIVPKAELLKLQMSNRNQPFISLTTVEAKLDAALQRYRSK